MSAQTAERFKVRLAVYLMLERDGKVFMLRRANTGYHDGDYGLIQGHVDGGETAEEAMSREAKEEIGIDVRPEDMQVVYVQHGPAENEPDEEYLCVYMKCTRWEGEPANLEPDKCDDIGWFSRDALPANTIPNVVVALNDIKNKVFYSNWGWEK